MNLDSWNNLFTMCGAEKARRLVYDLPLRVISTCQFCLWQVQLLSFGCDSELLACMLWNALPASGPFCILFGQGSCCIPALREKGSIMGTMFFVMGKVMTWFLKILQDLGVGWVCSFAAISPFAVPNCSHVWWLFWIGLCIDDIRLHMSKLVRKSGSINERIKKKNLVESILLNGRSLLTSLICHRASGGGDMLHGID